MSSRVLNCCRKTVQVVSRRHDRTLRTVVTLRPHNHPSPTTPKPSARTYSTDTTASGSRTSGQEQRAVGQSSQLVEHLNTVFSPLQFPPELATRILTHASHKDAAVSHNARLGFIGRRVLKTYLLLMLHSNPTISDQHDHNLILDRTLNTYVLGEHVAPKWSLDSVLRWKPVRIDSNVGEGGFSSTNPALIRGVGLYKVQGTTVEAVMGGIFHQFGGAVAHRVFHTRLLPHILLPGRPEGLHDAYHGLAQKICEGMGGVNGPLDVVNAKPILSDLPGSQKAQEESVARP